MGGCYSDESVDKSPEYYLSSKLNNNTIKDLIITSYLHEYDTITDFYLYKANHSYIVFRTVNNVSARCHLKGVPNKLSIEINLFPYEPDKNTIYSTSKSVDMLIDFCRQQMDDFGLYNNITNNCEHFALNVKSYLII